MDDEYGYRKKFKGYTVGQLIKTFNGDTGHNGWVRERGFFLVALREALLATTFNCSGFITEYGMSLHYKVKRVGKSIVPIGCPKNTKPKINMILVEPTLRMIEKHRKQKERRDGKNR